jgi:hypothetical protein
MKYYEVFRESGYDSAFLTTYAFSAQAFEDVTLSRLRSSGCRNITILIDQNMLNTSLDEFGVPSFAGRYYHLAKISLQGAFHPKITLLCGADKGRLLIGSANLTGLGLGGNRELVADIRYSDGESENVHLFGQAIRYIESHIPKDDPWFPFALERAFKSSPWFRRIYNEDTYVDRDDLNLFTDRPESTILDQIVLSINNDKIERLVVLSPFWDRELEGLRRLREALGMPVTDLLLQPKAGLFPVESLGRQENVRVFNAPTDGSSRFIHAKLFVALGAGWDHVISGSMNCSTPALLGSTISRGNAEAGIYKRIPKREALATLDLENYEDNPLEVSELPKQEERQHEESTSTNIIDGGDFKLRGRDLFWQPPSNQMFSAAEIRLFDRNVDDPSQILPVKSNKDVLWEIDSENPPMIAQVIGQDGIRSAPSLIVNLNVLDSKTSPVIRGRKGRIINDLEQLDQEHLIFYDVLNELVTLDLSEQKEKLYAVTSGSKTPLSDSTVQSPKILPYEAFIEARNRLNRQQKFNLTLYSSRGESSVSIINAFLNRLVGLVSEDLSEKEEQDFQKDLEKDLSITELENEEDETKQITESQEVRESKPMRRVHAVATARKLKEAVQTFEKRTKTLKGTRITTIELVRLRALLQIVLASAMPISGSSKEHQVLPLSSKESFEWPRLIGRLLRQHFGTIRTLQSLDVEENESEHFLVLDYLAMARVASHLAIKGSKASPSLVPIQKALIEIATHLDIQIRMYVSINNTDLARLNELEGMLSERFSHTVDVEKQN